MVDNGTKDDTLAAPSLEAATKPIASLDIWSHPVGVLYRALRKQ